MLNQIKSLFIFKNIFEHIRKKKKLKLIKHNKQLLNKLNITKEDFKDYLVLKGLSQYYKINIQDVDVENLDLSHCYHFDKIFNLIIKIKFKNLKEINLSNDDISDINNLTKAKFENLETLNLSNNEITDNNKYKCS